MSMVREGHSQETPPRTWRRPHGLDVLFEPVRNTSTDVEKTELPALLLDTLRKHLHGRGEDPKPMKISQRITGNTSTDVEKTH